MDKVVQKELPDEDLYSDELILYGTKLQGGKGDMNMIDNSSSYVLAGVDTFASLVDRFMENYPGYFVDDNIDHFLQNSVNKFLFSYGTGLNYKTKKIANNYSGKMINSVRKFTACKFMRNTEIYIDSGGFQVSMGAVPSEGIPEFIDMYYDFVKTYYKEFKYAFILDVPPGPGTDTFKSFEQVYELNKLSYTRAHELPEEARKKIIYIHHFRTPQIYNIWNDLLFKDNLGKDYNYYATGGLVAYGSSDITIPAVLYAIPLSSIIRYAKENNKTSLKFHVLGGANFTDVFYHQLFSEHIRRFHKIDINITYDSSSIFKGLFGARYITTLRGGETLVKMSLKEADLHLKFEEAMTIESKVYLELNKIANSYGLKQLAKEPNPIYAEEGGTFSKPVSTYLMLYVLQFYKDIEEMSKIIVSELYGLYESGKEQEFTEAINKTTKIFNQGKMTKKQKSKSVSVFNTLKILEDLDESYNEHFINKFTFTDDSAKLGSGGTLTF